MSTQTNAGGASHGHPCRRTPGFAISLMVVAPLLLLTLLLGLQELSVEAASLPRAPQVVPPAISQITGTPTIGLIVTVGTDANCSQGRTALTVTAGTPIHYCYEVTNTGDVTFTHHDLAATQLGSLLSNYPAMLAPGDSLTGSQTIPAAGTGTLNPHFTWAAKIDASGTVTASASQAVTVTVTPPPVTAQPTIQVTLTVGLERNQCGTSSQIFVAPGTVVHYCLRVTNTSSVTLTSHRFASTALNIDQALPVYYLEPGDTEDFTPALLEQLGFVPPFLTVNATAELPSVDMTITSFTEQGASVSASDSAAATVGRGGIRVEKTVGLTPDGCSDRTQLGVSPDQPLYYCLRLTNTGTVAWTEHTFTDTVKSVRGKFFLLLQPGDAVTLTQARIDARLVESFDPLAPTSLGPFTQSVTATNVLSYHVSNGQGYEADAAPSTQIDVPATPLDLLFIANNPFRDSCSGAQNTFVSTYGTPIWYCIRLKNNGSTPITHHRFTQLITPPTRSGTTYAYTSTVAFTYTLQPQATVVITNGFLTVTAKTLPVMGAYTITQPINPTGKFTNTLIYTASNPALDFQAVRRVQNVLNVSSPTPTITGTPTPSATATPFASFTATPTPFIQPATATPTWTWTPVMVSLLASPTATPNPLVRAVTTPVPNQFNSPLAQAQQQAPPVVQSPLETSTFTPDFAVIAATQTADAAMTATADATLWTPTATETASPTPTDTPTASPTPTETPTPTITQRPVEPATPAPTQDAFSLFGQVANRVVVAAGWIWFLGGSLVFFVSAGIIVGLSFRRQQRQRFDLYDLGDEPSTEPPTNPQPSAATPARRSRPPDDYDNWPASLR